MKQKGATAKTCTFAAPLRVVLGPVSTRYVFSLAASIFYTIHMKKKKTLSAFSYLSRCAPLIIVELVGVTSLLPTNRNQEGGGSYDINPVNNNGGEEADPGCHRQPSLNPSSNNERLLRSIVKINVMSFHHFL